MLAAKKAGPSRPPQAAGGNDEECEEEQHADRTIYEDGVGDFRGYYEDGAYVAYPEGQWDEEEEGEEHDDEEDGEGAGSENGKETDDEEDSAEDRPHNSSADEIRDAYFASITSRYVALRKLLRSDPPGSALGALPDTNPTEVGEWKRGADTFQRWEGRLRATDPLPAQVAGMHKDSVFRLLRVLLACKFLRKRIQLRERTSRWIWALLARLPDKGELDYMEIGWVRELGKRAVLLMVSLAELEVLREHCDVAGSSPEDHDEYEVGVDVEDYIEEDDDDLSRDTPVGAVDAPTPEVLGEHDEDKSGAKISVTRDYTGGTLQSRVDTTREANNAPLHTPSPDNASDIEMQLDSDMEDGEVAEPVPVAVEPPSPPRSDPIADMETAKARLLAQLNDDSIDEDEVGEDDDASASLIPVTQPAPAGQARKQTVRTTTADGAADPEQEEGECEFEYEADEGEEEEEEDADHERYQELDRAKVNERATLNMILTVAGEFYGQRDLLEFRDPFGGLQFQ